MADLITAPYTVGGDWNTWDGRTCTVGVNFFACYARAAGVATLGCVHEHLHRAAVCAEHLERLRGTGRGIACHRCAQGGEPHRCVMSEVTWEPL